MRYRFVAGETLTDAYREHLTSTWATVQTAPVTTTTGLLTYRQRLHVVHVSASGVATIAVSESTHTLTKTTGLHSTVGTQPGQPASTGLFYPDGGTYMLNPHSKQIGNAGHVPLFPSRPVSPGAHWNRRGVFYLGGVFVQPPVPVMEHLTFTGYGVVHGERVAEITIAVQAQKAGKAPPGGVWSNAPIMTNDTVTSTLSIGLSSGYLVRLVQDKTTTVREIVGKRSTTPGGWFRLATHTEMRRV